MTLPNYFLADLPPEAALTPAIITEACRALKRNREIYLSGRTTDNVVRLLDRVAADWLDPQFPFRQLALEQGPAALQLSRATLADGLDSWFRQVTRTNLETLLAQELGPAGRLDEMVASPAEAQTNRAALAVAPELLAHFTAGNLPVPALSSIAFGALLRSAQFVKCASGAELLPRLFAHSIYQADPKLGACLEIATWPREREDLESALFHELDCLTVTGDDSTLAAIRHQLPPFVRFVGYGYRVSFAYITAGVLSGLNAGRIVRRAATDVAAWDQLGCLSPHLIYVEHGGGISAEQFAEKLAEELARREETHPRSPLPVELAATITSRRAFYEIRAAHSPETKLWRSPDSTSWTVVYEADPRFQASCLHRFVYVKGVTGLTEALQAADPVRRHVSTVALAAPEDKAQAMATELARWGASRICQLGHMQQPPLTWRHDGRPPLADLFRWADWEMAPDES